MSRCNVAIGWDREGTLCWFCRICDISSALTNKCKWGLSFNSVRARSVGLVQSGIRHCKNITLYLNMCWWWMATLRILLQSSCAVRVCGAHNFSLKKINSCVVIIYSNICIPYQLDLNSIRSLAGHYLGLVFNITYAEMRQESNNMLFYTQMGTPVSFLYHFVF